MCSGATQEQETQAPRYRDRAQERRQGTAAEYADSERILATVSTENTKYLGGDMEHTHLVKGLDVALLSKVREELTKSTQQLRSELQQLGGSSGSGGAAAQSTAASAAHAQPQAGLQLRTSIAREVHKVLFQGQLERTVPVETFLPGRRTYEFDLSMPTAPDQPTVLMRTKDDCPAPEHLESAALEAPLMEALRKVLSLTSKGLRKKRARAADAAPAASNAAATGAAASSAAAGAPAASVAGPSIWSTRASADDDDIFADVGAYDPAAAIETKPAAAAALAPAPAAAAAAAAPVTYFDAGVDQAEEGAQPSEADIKSSVAQQVRQLARISERQVREGRLQQSAEDAAAERERREREERRQRMVQEMHGFSEYDMELGGGDGGSMSIKELMAQVCSARGECGAMPHIRCCTQHKAADALEKRQKQQQKRQQHRKNQKLETDLKKVQQVGGRCLRAFASQPWRDSVARVQLMEQKAKEKRGGASAPAEGD